MNYKIISLDSKLEWNAEVSKLPHSVYHTWDYNHAMSQSSKDKPFLFSALSEENQLICILAQRQRFMNLPEIYTPYGLGGIVIKDPFRSCNKIQEIWEAFVDANNFHCAYLMLHPAFLPPLQTWGLPVYDHLPVYLLDLKQSITSLWKALSKGHKYEIKRSRNLSYLKLTKDKNKILKPLIRLYSETLKRVGASATYHFSDQTLKEIVCSNHTQLFAAEENGRIVAITLFLTSKNITEYFLSAASETGRAHTRHLIWEAIKTLKSQEVCCLNLGGGIKAGDDLDKFKQRFGGIKKVLQVVKAVYDEKKYSHLCQVSGVSSTEREGYFPGYWK